MSILSDCPDCGNSLAYSSKRCRCGWSMGSGLNSHEIDTQCNYYHEDVCCENEGTISPRGLTGKWFCTRHWHDALTKSYKY